MGRGQPWGRDRLWAELAWGRGRDQSGGGASLGGGAERLRRAARRLDDRDKMATLQGGLLESDPGALSPAQLEQLRDLKVGAPPPPPSPQGCAPRVGARTRAGRRERGASGRDPRRPPEQSRCKSLNVQEELKQGPKSLPDTLT